MGSEMCIRDRPDTDNSAANGLDFHHNDHQSGDATAAHKQSSMALALASAVWLPDGKYLRPLPCHRAVKLRNLDPTKIGAVSESVFGNYFRQAC